MSIFTLEFDVWRDGVVERQYFATQTVATLAGITYDGVINDPGAFTRSVSLVGQPSSSVGNVILNNMDGALDYLWDCGWGRAFVMRELTDVRQPIASALIVASGIALPPDSSNPFKDIRIRFRDAIEQMKTPLLVDRYAGTTTDGTMETIEGDADLKDKIKPLCLTSRANVTPVLVNRFRLVYQVSHPYEGSKPCTSIVVRDRGVPLTFYQNYATKAALFAATFPSGGSTQRYSTCLAEGLFRLDDSPASSVTADVVMGAAADRSAPHAARTIIDILNADGAGIVIDAASFEAMHAKNPAEVCCYVDDETSADDLLVKIMQWVGFAIDAGSTGVFRAFAIEAPTGTPERVFTKRDWSDPGFGIRVDDKDQNGGSIPTYQVVVKYGGVETVQSAGDLAGAVGVTDPAYAQLVSEQYQQFATPDNDATAVAILAAHKNSVPLTVETGIRYAADAQARAYQLRSIFGVRRDRNRITVSRIGLSADFGSVQAVLTPRLGAAYTAGKKSIVVGRSDNFKSNTSTLDLFG